MVQPILLAQLEELKPLKQWVCYQAVWDEKKRKYSKIPKNLAHGQPMRTQYKRQEGCKTTT